MDHTAAFDLARRQHAHVASYQLLERGVSSQTIWRMRRSDAWDTPSSQVMCLHGAPVTQSSRLMAAVLDAGSGGFLAGPASAASWKTSGFSLLRVGRPDVTRPRGGTRRRSELAIVHEVLDLEPDHVTVLDGIPISTPTRMLFELAASERIERVARAVDNVWARNLTSHAHLQRMLDDWADRGRAGTVAMREILASRPDDYVPPASNLEGRFAVLAERYGVGPFRRQVDLGGESWIGRVDFRHVRCPLVVEVQSELFHAALLDGAADERRFALLHEAGFHVEPVWDHELWYHPERAMARIARVEARLRGAA